MESLFPAALRHIEAAIEHELLVEAFGKAGSNRFSIIDIPLRTHIEREVIVEQVVKDVQLFDSTEVTISLEGLPVVPVNDSYSTIFIPESRRGGRDIMSIVGVTTSPNGNVGGSYQGTNISSSGTLGAASSMLNSLSGSPVSGEHDVEWYAPNTIIVNSRFGNIGFGMLHANLSVNDKLTHIRNTTSIPFIELCIWKARQLIYTRLNIAMGRNMVSRGKELGVFSDAVREFRDARDTYMELLGKFRITVVLADPRKRRAIIKARMPKLLR